MSWIEKLYRTYENNSGNIGKGIVPLLPICHTTQNAHVTVVIDKKGDFVRASVVPKTEARTIIPATERSAGRTSGPTPHPLCDKLQYIASDYAQLGGDKKPCFDKFLALITAWAAADESQWKLRAVISYVRKGQVVSDLVKSSILHVDEKTSRLMTEWPDKKSKPEIFNLLAGESWQADAFVRWSVETPGDPQPEVWSDQGLWQSWERYYGSLESRRGLCFVTGIETDLATQHPAKIRNDGDKAKLISSGKTTGKDGKDKVDDSCGFTFLGRFTSAEGACGVGFQVTQKAHSALRWLIARQGKRDGEQAVVAWAVSGADVPDLQADTFSFLFGGEQAPPPKIGYTAQEVGVALSRKMAGYSAKLKPIDDIVVLGLDSATPGRMAISYYRELTGSEFLERIESWHTGCCWQQYFGKDRIFFGAPAPRDIAEVAFGRRIDDKLRKATVERLLPCIIDGAPIPRDLVESCVRRASNRNGIEYWEWEKALGIACALYRKQNEKEGYSMALDENRTTRDYLYGRLLALAENIEHWAINIGGEKRQTNAERMMQRFADRPYSTWRTIELALVPYKIRLSHKATKLNAMIDAVHCKFDTPEEYSRDTKLSGEFLLGYHCQRSALKPVAGPTTPDSVDKTEESED